MVEQKQCDIIQNLKDAGCNSQMIQEVMQSIQAGRIAEGMRLLKQHRRDLLLSLHKAQTYIDRLDYLIYQMNKKYPLER